MSTGEEQFLRILQGQVDSSSASAIAKSLAQAGDLVRVLDLLVELQSSSPKLIEKTVQALPEVHYRCGSEIILQWLDLTVSLAGHSGATTLKYLQQSPVILGILDSSSDRREVLTVALELADAHSEYAANCAFEFFHKAPELLLVTSPEDLSGWADIGLELTEWNSVVGIELFREVPKIAEVLSQDLVRAWINFGMKLITVNHLGKPDYLGTLEFFRNSPVLLAELPDERLRPLVVNVGSTLADRSPEIGLTFLAEAPRLFHSVPDSERQLKMAQYGGLLADRSAEGALAFFRQCPNILSLMGSPDSGHEAFETWFQGGMEILEYSPEGAQAYFSMETGKALAAVEQAMNGVALRQVARSLSMLAEMLSGEKVTVASLPDSGKINQGQDGHPNTLDGQNIGKRPTVSHDGKTLRLPSLVNTFPTRDANLRIFTVMTAHEMGHWEFGTYRLDLNSLDDLAMEVGTRYSRFAEEQSNFSPSTLADLFALYPQKGVIQDLWTILEDARVEYRLQTEYPGLRQDLAALARESISTHSFLHGMTVREMVIDSLLLRFTADQDSPGSVVIPQDLQPISDRVWADAQTILHQEVSAEDSVRLADRLYQLLDQMIAKVQVTEQDDLSQNSSPEGEEVSPGPRAAEVSGDYRPITNWSYRGTMDPEQVGGGEEILGAEGPSAAKPFDGQNKGGSEKDRDSSYRASEKVLKESAIERTSPPEAISPTVIEEWLRVERNESTIRYPGDGGTRSFVYAEWDGSIRDYRSHWCCIKERFGAEGSPDFAQMTLEKHAPGVRLLRRYFESIRPTGMRRMWGQEDGDDIDLNAAIRRVAERKVGTEPTDRIYIRRDKRDRQVASAFLIDMSGSTGRQIESGGRRVIDVEKEGLVLLSEAMEAIGDQYALYGFSGQGRQQVDFIILKDFGETLRYRVGQRIEAVKPLHQNRDGAAIRHTTRKLLECSARHRLLVLMSDGRPLDDEYGDEYALEDTKMALREARLEGVIPYCVTVDLDARDYLYRMYGEVGFVIIDDVSALPEHLPRMYQRLTTS